MARIDSIPGEDILRRWIVSVYQATGDNDYAVEWQTEVLGVSSSGNGVASGDLTGDGVPEFAVCAVPDLYVFQAAGPDTYRPIWYIPVDLTYLPLITDLDRNGRAEVAFNQGGLVRLFERDGPISSPRAPERVSAVPGGPDRVALRWSGPKDVHYRVYRGRSPEDLAAVANGLAVQVFVDSLLSPVTAYFYAVASVDTAGQEGPRSEVVSATTSRLTPVVLRAEPLTLRRVALDSDAALGPEQAEQPQNFLVLPDSLRPSSANLDRGGHRVMLSFEGNLKPGATYSLVASGLQDSSGAPLAFPINRISAGFSMSSAGPPAAPFDLDRNGAVDLTDFFLFAEAFGTSLPRFDFNGDGVVDLSDFFLFAGAFGSVRR